MKTVLLAYERDQDLAAIETLLQTRGYRVLKTRSGVEAIELARREAPQVVVSDVLLPKLDGFALCRRIKEDAFLNHTPVLLMSFRIEGAKYEAFAAEVGAERFLPRGSTLEDLVERLDGLSPGSGTMRMPALVPELMERREQDRRQGRRPRAPGPGSRGRAAAARRRRARSPAKRPSAPRASAPTSRRAARRARVSCSSSCRNCRRDCRNSNLASASSRRPRARRAARPSSRRPSWRASACSNRGSPNCRQRAPAPRRRPWTPSAPSWRSRVPTWLSDMETHEMRVGERFGGGAVRLAPEALRGRSIVDLLPGYAPDADPAHAVGRDAAARRRLGTRCSSCGASRSRYAGRACWLTPRATSPTSARGRRSHERRAAPCARARVLAARRPASSTREGRHRSTPTRRSSRWSASSADGACAG